MNRRKELLEQYKQRKIVGGIYRIDNTENGRFLLGWSDDLVGEENRHNFSVMMGTCVFGALTFDWRDFGAKAFRFSRVEELEKTPEQTTEQFRDDLKTLLEMHLERTDLSNSYNK